MTEVKKPTEEVGTQTNRIKKPNTQYIDKNTGSVRDSISGALEEEENKPFDLNKQLLEEYPEMEKLSGLPKKDAPKDTWNVSQIYVNGETIDSFIKSVINKKPTGDIEYLLKMVEDGLNELQAQNNPDYENFINKESVKLKDRKSRANQAIGNKKRNIDNMGIYE